jgi:hypothetical protein
MSIEAIAATGLGGMGGAGAMPPPTETVQAGPGASIADITGFQGALSAAGGGMSSTASDAISPAMKAMFSQLEKVNGEAKSVGDYAQAAQASGAEMTPGEIVNLTMKCHEFMFHCQLTSNIANRTSDGIQQLFRQQS